MSSRKSDDRDQQPQEHRRPQSFTSRELDWYGEAYERAYIEKLKIDDALATLAAKLQPKKTVLH